MAGRTHKTLYLQDPETTDTYTWGGENTGGATMLWSDFKLGPDAHADPSTDINIDSTTEGAKATTHNYCWPKCFNDLYYVDGYVSGQALVWLKGGDTADAELTKITATIDRVDSNGNRTTIGSGSANYINFISTSSSTPYEATAPFFFDVNGGSVPITDDDRLYIKLELYAYKSEDVSVDAKIYHSPDPANEDTKITLPLILG